MNRLLALFLAFPLVFSSCQFTPSFSAIEKDGAGINTMPVDLANKVVLQGTAVSLVKNPVSTVAKGVSLLKRRTVLTFSPVTDAIPSSGVGIDEPIEVALTRMGLPEPVAGKIDFLVDGKQFFPALEKAVGNARTSVDTRVYIFDNDKVAMRYADLLRKKSTEVRVRVLMDELGSLTSWWSDRPPSERSLEKGTSMRNYLRAGDSMVSVRKSLNPWFVTDHSKMFLIDGKVAFIGGMNVGWEYHYGWHDLMARVEGPVVMALQNNFNRAWRLQGRGGDWAIPFYRSIKHREVVNDGEIGFRVLRTGVNVTQIEEAMIAALKRSCRRIYLENPYVTSGRIQQEIIAAGKRGVDVRVVFCKDNDSDLFQKNNNSVAKRLVEEGVRVYQLPRFSHAKAIVVDDWTCIGSANLDALSLQINQEVNLAFTDKTATAKLVREMFHPHFSKAKLLRKSDVKDWGNFAAEVVAKQL